MSRLIPQGIISKRWIALLAIPCLSLAGVVDTSPAGFKTESNASIAATQEQVWAALLQVGKWWDPEHTWSGDAGRMSINASAGGCFCESLPGGGGVQHMAVVWVAPNKTLRMTGGLGPLQESGVVGSMTFELAKGANGGTLLKLTYSAGGYYQGGLDKVAGAVDGVLSAQLARLKNFVERGAPK